MRRVAKCLEIDQTKAFINKQYDLGLHLAYVNGQIIIISDRKGVQNWFPLPNRNIYVCLKRELVLVLTDW